MPIYEKKAEKLRVRKTPAAKRTTYTYPIYDGSTITLIPGKDGITEEFIVLLHHLDDAEVRNNLKNGRPELTAEEKQAVKEWENAHPGEKAPRNWNLSIDYVMSDDEHDSEKAAIENIPDGSEVSPEVEMLRVRLLKLCQNVRNRFMNFIICEVSM